MTVRELLDLVPILEQTDPNDVVHIDAGSSSIIILNTRPGLHQPMGEPQDNLTKRDMEFLRSLRVAV